MKLYELTNDYNELNALLNDDTQEISIEAITEIMEQMAGDIDEKIGNIASLIKSKLALAKAIKEEETGLKERREKIEKQTERLKEYLALEMLKIDKTKFEDSKHKITFRKSVSVSINEDIFPEELKIEEIKYKIPSKTELKERLNNGEIIQGVSLVTSQNIQIK